MAIEHRRGTVVGGDVRRSTPTRSTLLNNVVVGMVALFAAIMVVNTVRVGRRRPAAGARPAAAARRHPGPGRRDSVTLEAALVAVIGVVVGSVASLGTVVPFSRSSSTRAGPRRHALAGWWCGWPPCCSPSAAPLVAVRRAVRTPALEAVGPDDRSGIMGPWTIPAAVAGRPVRSRRPGSGWSRSRRRRCALAIPALVLAMLTIVGWPTSPLVVGLGIARRRGAGDRALTDAHRRWPLGSSARRSRRGTPTRRRSRRSARPFTWLRDQARWRDVGHLGFSATGGLVMSGLLVLLLAAVATTWSMPLLDGRLGVAVLFCSARLAGRLVDRRRPGAGGPRSRERSILGRTRVEQLERRVEEVTTLPRRDARPQRRRGAPDRARPARRRPGPDRVGRHERRPGREAHERDPEAAAGCCARPGETTVDRARGPALGGPRHPPAGARRPRPGRRHRGARPADPAPGDRRGRRPDRLPAPVESAAYFAVAECLANAVKHAGATRVGRWCTTASRLRLVVGDDGRGGADPAEGGGLAGVAQRLGRSTARWRSTAPSGARPS